jgi:hypothetical protein
MPYIGSSPNFGAVESQTITTANGSTAAFTLNQFVPDSDSIIVTVGNVVQEPTTAYSAVGTTITFTENVPNGDTIVIRYLGRSVDVPTTYTNINRFKFVATGGQDTFQNNDANGLELSYTAGNIDVFMNGVRLDESDFTASNGTSVVLGTNASASDEIIIIAYKSVLVSNALDKSSGGTVSGTTVFSGQTTFSGQAYFSGGIFGDVSFDSGTLKIDSGNNRVGIGTNSPTTQLTVADNSGGDISLTTNSQAGSQASPLNMDINFKGYQNNTMAIIRSHDESSSTGHGELQFHTTKNGVGTTEKMNIDHDGNTKIRNANATGPILDIGTTSTSVADDGVIGGIDFSSGSSSTVNARLHARQYDTSENAGYFSNELRAPNGNSLGEVHREFMTQNAIGGVYIKRPMPSNVYYYRDIYKSLSLSASQSSGTTFITLNQNDYFCSISCLVDAWTVDTSYPTSALMRRYGLTANTHLGRGSWSARLTQYLDMGEYNTGATDHSSASVNFSLSIHTTKSAGSNNGYLYIRYHTGSYTSGPATIRLSGIFLNARVDDQPITANL